MLTVDAAEEQLKSLAQTLIVVVRSPGQPGLMQIVVSSEPASVTGTAPAMTLNFGGAYNAVLLGHEDD